MRTRLIGLLAVPALVALWVPGGVSGASSGTVTIRDGGLSPTVARIDVPGKVTWSNRGARPHVVVSLSASFRPLVLQPGQSKSVTFRSRRCERYSVDGRFNGRVLAGVSACAGGGGSGGGSPPGVEEKVFRYDVRVTAYLHQVETYSSANNPEGNGTTDLELSWTGTWRKFELKLSSGEGSTAFFTAPASERRGNGRGSAHMVGDSSGLRPLFREDRLRGQGPGEPTGLEEQGR